MRRARSIACAARGDAGVVMVMVALMFPVLIGFSGLVIDVGNWFAHKRHLQTQADAGALAGAGRFRFPCSDDVILDEVAKYSSVENDQARDYNPQIGDTPPEELHREDNSPTWFDQSTPVDDSVREGGPCATKMIDVKLTETNLPWWLKVAQVPYINTHARVEIMQQTTSRGALPVGVPEVGPLRARALFVDESTGSVVASTDLQRSGTSNGLAIWSNLATPVPVTVDTARIGVRIVLSGAASTQCGDPLVSCYGAGTQTAIVAGAPGLTHIRGWSSTPAGTATAPQARSVDLLSGTCGDSYFTASAASCTVGIRATIDGLPSTATVFARRATGSNTRVNLSYADGVWSASSGIPVAPGEGPVSINIFHGGGNGTLIGTVQRTYAASEDLSRSGPIKLLRLSENSIVGANSFERCATCTHNLVVTLGVKPSLQNASSVSDPIVALKVAGGGSQNQALDCDPELANLRDELEAGCRPSYRINEGTTACPGGAQTLWATEQPWQCVAINTGTTVGQVTQGINLRILGDANPASCTAPNNWASFPDFDRGDPRIVQVFLTPFGAFTGSGGSTVPVTGFATFYVTGWHNGACQGQGDDPAGQGEIVGHFIQYIDTLGTGGGDEVCDETSLNSCVAVFTR